MKKVTLFFILLFIAISLNARWIYFDVGIGSDITEINFHTETIYV